MIGRTQNKTLKKLIQLTFDPFEDAKSCPDPDDVVFMIMVSPCTNA